MIRACDSCVQNTLEKGMAETVGGRRKDTHMDMGTHMHTQTLDAQCAYCSVLNKEVK